MGKPLIISPLQWDVKETLAGLRNWLNWISVMGAILASVLIRNPADAKVPGYATEFGTPLPPCLHRVLSANVVRNKHVFIIGDVHGCLDELRLLIQKAELTPDNSVLIFCGDIVNKGPYNRETLAFVRGLSNAYTVRGNHEEHVISNWVKLHNNTNCTLTKKYDWLHQLTEDEVNYLRTLPYTISIPSLKAIVVHGGLFPWKPLHLQQPCDMTLMRNIIDVDTQSPRPTKHIDVGCPWASLWMGPEQVYFGHDARRGLQRYRYATGLDTGCLYGKRLTGVFLTGSQQFVTVEAKRVYRKPVGIKYV